MKWTVPRIWQGQTAYLLGGGPSIGEQPIGLLAGQRCIAINHSWRLAPWADVLYFCDANWWRRQRGDDYSYAGSVITIAPELLGEPDLLVLERGPAYGLSTDPNALATGHNSGYQAINLAYLLGASRIVLLGYDMGWQGNRHHWHDYYSVASQSVYQGMMLPAFRHLVKPLAAAGVQVLNATPGSRLKCWPMVDLEATLDAIAA